MLPLLQNCFRLFEQNLLALAFRGSLEVGMGLDLRVAAVARGHAC